MASFYRPGEPEVTGVGLIGTGLMGQCHALVRNSVRTVFGDLEKDRLIYLGEANADLFDPEVDVISLTMPNQFHPEMAIAVRKSGKVSLLGYNYI